MEKLLVVAIGPDAAGLLTLEAAQALEAGGRILLRTARHGAADWLRARGIAFESLDALYEHADDFDALNAAAADRILKALEEGPLCYGVPDPATDATVGVLAERGTDMQILAGVSQTAVTRAQAIEAGFSPAQGLFTIAAVDLLAREGKQLDPSVPMLVTELNSALLAGEIKLRLLDVYAPEHRVLLHGEANILENLDRAEKYSHLSCVYIPQSPMTDRSRYMFSDLLEVMARLRSPVDGCPWDKEQTHLTLRPYVIEEAYELVDAIDRDDMDSVADELGDVLLQVVFHAQIAREHGEFAISDVTSAICHKMITRHAHIFGDVVCKTSDDVLRSWEAIKKKEKGLRGAAESMRDIPGHLPALMRAGKVQSKARQVGFDWDDASAALEKVGEETDEVREAVRTGQALEMEFGDLLFAAVNAARLAGIQPELALGAATDKFIRRFEQMEKAITGDGKRMQEMTLEAMDVYWDAVKRTERE